PQSFRWRLLLLPTDVVGEEKHRGISGSTVACYLYAAPPSPALVDSSDADRGIFGYGLGAGVGGPRPALRPLEHRQPRKRMLELSLISLTGEISHGPIVFTKALQALGGRWC